MNKEQIRKTYGIEGDDCQKIMECAERIVEDGWTLDTTTIALCEVYNRGRFVSSACETAKKDIDFYREALETATATIYALESELQGSREKVAEFSSQNKCHREALEKATAMVKTLSEKKTLIPFYMIYVEGQRGPVYQHETLESAETEAQRLVSSVGKAAFILQPVEKWVPDIKAKQTEMDELDKPLPF